MSNEQAHGQDPHAEETKARWGHTDAYKTSAKRTKSYTPEDWTRIKAENEQIEDYSVSETTLEQVFLSFAKKQRAEEGPEAMVNEPMPAPFVQQMSRQSGDEVVFSSVQRPD